MQFTRCAEAIALLFKIVLLCKTIVLALPLYSASQLRVMFSPVGCPPLCPAISSEPCSSEKVEGRLEPPRKPVDPHIHASYRVACSLQKRPVHTQHKPVRKVFTQHWTTSLKHSFVRAPTIIDLLTQYKPAPQVQLEAFIEAVQVCTSR